MSRIGIDFTFISDPEISTHLFTGSLSINLAEILDGISSIGESHHFILIVNSAAEKFVKERFPDFAVCPVGSLVSKLAFFLRQKQVSSRRMKREGTYRKILKAKNIDRVWLPWLVPEELCDADVQFFGICHDLKFTELYNHETCRRALETPLHLNAISEYVKYEILQHFDVPESKISTIPNCIRPLPQSAYAENIPGLMNRNYILDANAYGPEKNTLTMLRAFDRIKGLSDCDLVLMGGYIVHEHQEYFESIQTFIEERNLEDRVHVYLGVSEEIRNWVFNNCTLFVTPSENEGFGRTPIEAALCLKPVISTRATSLPEITAGLVHYYDDPRDDEALSELILDVLAHPDPPEKLREIRDCYTSRHSPETVARMYMDMFRSIGWM